MIEILGSSLIGNLIGVASLIVGIVSLIVTIRTMKTATRIEEEVRRENVKTLDKKRFNDNKPSYEKKLNTKRKAVLSNQTLSLTMCNDVLSIIHDIKGYDTVLSKEDIEIIEQQRKELQRMSGDLQNKVNMNENIQTFDSIVATVLNILEKGDNVL